MKIGFSSIRHILLVAFAFIPFTSLRLSFFGVGELLISVSFFLFILVTGARFRISKIIFPYFMFWVPFLLLMFLGVANNVIFLNSSSGRQFSGFFDYFSYIFIVLTILMLSDERLYSGSSAPKFFGDVFLIWGVLYSLLYILSLFFASIFGFNLRYYDFFSPLVDNVHQAASMTCALTFVMFFFMAKSTGLLWRSVYLMLGLLFLRMALESGSTKAFMGIVFGSGIALFFLIFYRESARGRIYFNAMSCIFVLMSLLIFSALYFEELAKVAVAFFVENDQSHAREALYLNGVRHGMESFFVGYGPGSHAPYGSGFNDAHNTVLTVFLQGGIIPVFLLVICFLRMFLAVKGTLFLVSALAAISMYFLGGDILRRLPIWVILIGISYLSQCSAKEVDNRRGLGHE